MPRIICPYCSRSFLPEEYGKHIRDEERQINGLAQAAIVATTAKVVKAAKVPKVAKVAKAAKVQVDVSGELYTCPFCFMLTQSLKVLGEHVREHDILGQ